MPESFGARLRQRREEQQIALRTIAEQTKIKMSLLEALERDDVSQWPSGIFRRAYVRSYARFIGLDPDAVVREFLEVHPEAPEFLSAAPVVAAEGEGSQANPGGPAILRSLVGAALDSLSRLRRGPSVRDLPVRQEVAVHDGRSYFDDPGEYADSLSSSEPLDVRDAETATVHARTPEPPVLYAPEPEVPEVRVSPPVPPPEVEARPLSKPRMLVGDPDFAAVARLCTEFGRIESAEELNLLLEEAARILDAPGLIVWIWDPLAGGLRAALAHGYSSQVLAQLPTVARDADNATAAAFRLAETCAINGNDDVSGALAVPLLTSGGCAGVLAIELQHGSEQRALVRAAATIIAASLAQLMPRSRSTHVNEAADMAVSAAR